MFKSTLDNVICISSNMLFTFFTVSLNNVVAGVMGAIVGIIITLLLTTICCGCYCWYTRRRSECSTTYALRTQIYYRLTGQLIKERERRMYSDNFLMNPDEKCSLMHDN